MAGWLRRTFAEPNIGRHLVRAEFEGDENEVIVDEVHRHWVVYTRPALEALLGVAFVAVIPFTSLQSGWLPFLIAAGLFAHAGWRALNENMDRFVITNKRVFRVRGVLSQSLAIVPLRRILDITVNTPLIGRMLGYGHFVFESAAQEQGLREIRYVGDPGSRQRKIQRLVQQRDPRSPRIG